ncbi:CAP domain-containing protein [Paenibacillus sp. GP183]|uniref:CAP domain-containing protein n=1 Tax=Paenibacillus sp. GP183 TaxID=1882751 RepID=UPI0008972DE6|nr:CAP domain-containing protein [Paenibacillus sp. GP183]SEB44881.1 uncharacterized protein, YkwD family [Paenibacillus sp. GP183]
MRFRKSVLTGILALSTIIGAGAASAASYTVKSSDTMSLIANRNGISLSSLIKANPQISNPNNIWPGLVLNIPGASYSPPSPPKSTGSTTPKSTGSTISVSSYANQVVSLVNKERANAGLSALSSDSALSSMALAKAKDMYNNNYFSHTSPTYGSPFAMMTAFGIKYSYAGENIAMGQRTPQEVMTAWMNSAGHRQNILSPNFAKIGVAYYNGEWVQEFTK